MYNFTLVVLGKELVLDKKYPFEIIYYENNLRETISKVKTKYVLFIKSKDLLSNKYWDLVINKTANEFDCCFINFKCNYLNYSDNKIPTEYKEIKGMLPFYGSYIWSFIFDTEKFKLLFDKPGEQSFNECVKENFKKTDCINEIVYFHRIENESVLNENDLFYVDKKREQHLKNVIYIGDGISGTFNGYISWVRNIGRCFGDKYEINIIYTEMKDNLHKELSKFFKLIKYDNKINYLCDRLLLTYSDYFYPRNIISIDKNYMFIHGNPSDYPNSKHYYDDVYSEYVAVSKTAANKSIGYYPRNDIKVVYNPYKLDPSFVKPHLRLVTTMRSSDIKRPERITKFASILDELEIPYTWNVFTDKNENTNINGVIYRRRQPNTMPYVNDSDYLVLLSDSESFSYSVVEALSVNTKVIVTPLEVYDEIGVKDGINGFIVPKEYFEESNKEKLVDFVKKIYDNKDMKISYEFDEKLYEGFNDIFLK